MGKDFVSVACFVFLFTLCFVMATPAGASSVVEDLWIEKASMHEARARLGVAVVDEQIYAIGGSTSTGQFLGTNEKYDPTSDVWVFKEFMPTPRASFGVAVCQNKIYCIGGLSAVEQHPYKRLVSDVNEVYDPASDSWQTLTPLPAPKEGVQANVVDNKIYVLGGNSSENYVYDVAADSWAEKASMPVVPQLNSGWSCVSAVISGKIHVLGLNSEGAFHLIYDPDANTWSSGALNGVAYASAAVTTGINAPKRLYVFSAAYTVWELNPPPVTTAVYDPTSDAWGSGASMSTERANTGVAVVKDQLYVIGGETLEVGMNALASAANEQYTPIGYHAPDDNSPAVDVLSPKAIAYNSSDVALTFAVNGTVSHLSYSLDDQNSISLSGNTTLTNLTNGNHTIQVYAQDTTGNVAASKLLQFTISNTQPEPFPATSFIVVCSLLVAIVIAGTAYHAKTKKPLQ
ncbi:MAG: hypothetical protein NWF04_01380 [Candidatus Bathyarchaeota archaeon]|nr:hypothetical protein [Candidatus Bathyarchaeota archaeon]